MGMTLSQFGSSAAGGYIYVTKADGTSIVSTFPNNYAAWGAVQEILGSSASLTSPTVLTDATYGFRVFGDTAGVLGVVSGTELTGYLVNRGAQSASYKVAVTLASNTLTTTRVTGNMFVVLDTEGAGAADTLDHISIAGAVENDTICIVAASAARVITVTEYDNQIVLTNNANFVTGDGAQQIVLRYLNAVWCEVSRAGIVPTVAIQRAASIAIPVQGINSTAMGTSGTTTYVPGTDKGYQVITGSPVLAGGIVFTTGGSPIDGDEFVLDYRATPTLGGNTVTIFGITLTTTQAAQKCVITTKYKTSNTTWYSTLYVNGNAIDFATTTQLDTKEPSLGNPAANGFVLSSQTDGTRSWVPNVSGLFTIHAPVSINATATATASEVASGYIKSTSAAGTVITLPTGTVLGAYLGATQGLTFDLFIDNTAGASTVTIAVNTNAILSASAVANAATKGLLTIPSGVTGQGSFRIMFSSATAYTFERN